MTQVDAILELFRLRGDSEYGGEAVTQLEHALQAATLAEESGASAELIVAALLHDVGHLLHDLPDDAPDSGVDDHHERTGCRFLRDAFPPAVYEPVLMHVAAKRYLCATDENYAAGLSEPSLISLQLQGGPMTDAEVARFRERTHYEEAIRLRLWDDQAKVVGLQTPSLTHFEHYLKQTVKKDSADDQIV